MDNILEYGKKVFEVEIDGLVKMKDSLNESFEEMVESIDKCSGRVICTGMGKSGHIAKKIVATMASLGIKAFFLHPAEGAHGDLGILSKDDLVLAITNSGETDEILTLIPTIQKVGATLCSIIGREGSTLESFSYKTIVFPQIEEAYLGDLVPTTSSTLALVIGDALAVAVAKKNNFQSEDFALYHPKGTLGRKLTMKVGDLMKAGDENAYIGENVSVKEATLEMCKKPIGCVNIINEEKELQGIFTDGDLRRLLIDKGEEALNMSICDVMTKTPFVTTSDILIIDFIKILDKHEKRLSVVPVVEDKKILGTIKIADIVKAGLI